MKPPVLRLEAIPGSCGSCRLVVDMHMPFEDAVQVMRILAGFQGAITSKPAALDRASPPQPPEDSSMTSVMRPGPGRKFHGLKPENPDLGWTWVIPTMDLEAMGAGRIMQLRERFVPGSETYLCTIGDHVLAALVLVRGEAGEVFGETSFHHIADMPSGFWDETIEPSLMGFLREQIIDDGLACSPDEFMLQKICKDLVDEATGCENPDKKLWISQV